MKHINVFLLFSIAYRFVYSASINDLVKIILRNRQENQWKEESRKRSDSLSLPDISSYGNTYSNYAKKPATGIKSLLKSIGIEERPVVSISRQHVDENDENAKTDMLYKRLILDLEDIIGLENKVEKDQSKVNLLQNRQDSKLTKRPFVRTDQIPSKRGASSSSPPGNNYYHIRKYYIHSGWRAGKKRQADIQPLHKSILAKSSIPKQQAGPPCETNDETADKNESALWTKGESNDENVKGEKLYKQVIDELNDVIIKEGKTERAINRRKDTSSGNLSKLFAQYM